MSRIRIVTDSTADLPKEIIDELGIVVVPLKVAFGREIYRDGIDLSSREFIARLQSDSVIPTTSQPSPGEFVAVYESLAAKGDTIISIHISGKLSGTVQSAQTAKMMADVKGIHVIDSRSASMGLGMVVIAAAKAAREGKSLREVLAIVKDRIEKGIVLFLVDTLEYLEKGGRIGKASAFLGTLLKIKPILTLDEEGAIVPLEKVRGTNAAIDRISQLIAERIDISNKYNCAFVYGNDDTAAARLREKVTQKVKCRFCMLGELGSVIMAHAGPGLVGVIVSPE